MMRMPGDVAERPTVHGIRSAGTGMTMAVLREVSRQRHVEPFLPDDDVFGVNVVVPIAPEAAEIEGGGLRAAQGAGDLEAQQCPPSRQGGRLDRGGPGSRRVAPP
jgi:hypothetical protein